MPFRIYRPRLISNIEASKRMKSRRWFRNCFKFSATESNNCPICLHSFTNALTLSCGHQFCSFCIQEWAKTIKEQQSSSSQPPQPSCPTCRAPCSNAIPKSSRTPKEIIDDLLSTTTNDSILEILHAIHTAEQDFVLDDLLTALSTSVLMHSERDTAEFPEEYRSWMRSKAQIGDEEVRALLAEFLGGELMNWELKSFVSLWLVTKLRGLELEKAILEWARVVRPDP